MRRAEILAHLEKHGLDVHNELCTLHENCKSCRRTERVKVLGVTFKACIYCCCYRPWMELVRTIEDTLKIRLVSERSLSLTRFRSIDDHLHRMVVGAEIDRLFFGGKNGNCRFAAIRDIAKEHKRLGIHNVNLRRALPSRLICSHCGKTSDSFWCMVHYYSNNSTEWKTFRELMDFKHQYECTVRVSDDFVQLLRSSRLLYGEVEGTSSRLVSINLKSQFCSPRCRNLAYQRENRINHNLKKQRKAICQGRKTLKEIRRMLKSFNHDPSSSPNAESRPEQTSQH